MPETIRVSSRAGKAVPVEARPTPQPMASDRAATRRQDTRPFVPDTVRLSGLAVPVGAPGQARPTPLPKPSAPLTRGKKSKDSSLLGMFVPSLGRKGKGALVPPRGTPDATLEVSENDLSLVESSTTELTLSDLSAVSELPAQRGSEHSDPPPLPGQNPRRQSPWLVWSLVGGAWCVMIALALLAVDDAPKSQELRVDQKAAPAESPLTGASRPDVLETTPKLAITAPATLAPEGRTAPVQELVEKPAAETELAPPAALATPSEVTKSAAEERHEKRVQKRSERRAKAAAQKRKRMKRLRAQKRAAAHG